MRTVSIATLLAEGAILAIQDGNHGEKHPKAADYVEDDGVPFVMARDFPNGSLDLRNVTLLGREVATKLRIGFAKPGDVLLTHKGTLGATGIVPDAHEFVMLTPQVTYYRTDPRKLLNTYLRAAFRAPDFQHQLSSFSAQSTRPFVSISAQRSLTLPIPPLAVQRRIAGILSAYDDLIENCERRIRVLDEMARALYREWFVLFRYPGHQKTPLVDSPLGRIPKGWKVRPVSESFEILGGGTPSRKEPDYWTDGTVEWFSPTHLTSAGTMFMDTSGERITERGLAESSAKLFPAMSVMMTSRATIGAIAINTTPACTNQGFITCIPNERMPLISLFHWLRSNVPLFERMASGATFKEISRGVFRTIDVLLPVSPLVHRFEHVARPMAEESLSLQRTLGKLRNTRDLLLPRLLSGELAVDAA
jgi:type I restriction enzyme S subunit